MSMPVQKLRAMGATAVVVLVLLGLMYLTLRLAQDRQEQVARAEVADQALTVAAQIESSLNADVFLANGLSAMLVASPDLSPAIIQSALKVLYDSSRHLKNIGLAPGNRITYLYPLAGNEKALGLYYPDEPTQWPAVQAAMERKSTILAGPVRLRQGGMGLISRTPVYRDGDRYWGMLSLVLDADALLQQAQQVAEKQGLRLALRGKDGQGEQGEVFYGDPALFAADAVLLTIRVPGGTWQMALEPIQGWSHRSRLSHLWGLLGLGVVLLAGLSMYLYLVGRAAVNTSERRLRAFLNTSPDGVIVINAKGLIEEFNPGAERMFGFAPEEVLGRSVNTLMRSSDAAEHDQHLSRTRSSNVRNMSSGREIYGQRKDGSVFPIEVTVGEAQVEGRLVHVGILRDITVRKEYEQRLHELATRDSLTGTANRRAIMSALEEMWGVAQRYQRPLSVLMLDVDHFKRINDTHGHGVGDRVLVQLVAWVNKGLRAADRMGRLGGEEFLLVLPETTREQALQLGQRLLETVAQSDVELEGQPPLRFTVSIGAACSSDAVQTMEGLVQQADAALYRAKSLGRNRCC